MKKLLYILLTLLVCTSCGVSQEVVIQQKNDTPEQKIIQVKQAGMISQKFGSETQDDNETITPITQ